MNQITTNGLIASLRALTHEIKRIENRLNNEDLDEDISEELGLFVTDLHEVVSAISNEYENRRENDNDLAPAQALLDLFSIEEMP